MRFLELMLVRATGLRRGDAMVMAATTLLIVKYLSFADRNLDHSHS